MGTFSPDGQMQSTWYVRVGSTFKKRYVWRTGDPAAGVDLTGWTARSHVRSKLGAPDHLLELTTENGGITLGPDGGIDVFIDYGPDGTELLSDQKKAVFDIELTSPDASFRRNLIGGTIAVYGEVTQP